MQRDDSHLDDTVGTATAEVDAAEQFFLQWFSVEANYFSPTNPQGVYASQVLKQPKQQAVGKPASHDQNRT